MVYLISYTLIASQYVILYTVWAGPYAAPIFCSSA